MRPISVCYYFCGKAGTSPCLVITALIFSRFIWLKEQGPDFADFEWQGGYADFSVSRSNLEDVKKYIASQDVHHRKVGFQDELRALLCKHEIEWDERYV